MIALPGYQILTQIYESANSLVYRGFRNSDNKAVILKVLRQAYPSPEQLTRYKQEYEITRNLNLDGAVKSYTLEKYQRTLIIVFEDFGGDSLSLLMASRKFTLSEFLTISIKITESLSFIHAANIIHKDINPSNIVLNPETGQLKIIDFGISTVLHRESPPIRNPNVLSGTLAYMSPEQTGRMSRALDYRTDFYSLGATFYELLTHCLPFDTTDAMELVHCHIALTPVPPHELNPEIPLAVSDIVMKLLAKTAEERYQSAWGIKADLEECLTHLQVTGKISKFPLSRGDIIDKFQIPQKLYGRERQIEILLKGFERVNQGTTEMMLVSGYSGIGKSALVQVLYKPITQQRGYFISGKFDSFGRNIPYSAVVSAFSDLMRQLLTETEAQLNQWREKLLAAFGANGQVIIDLLPEVELIVGKQPEVPELPPSLAENRLRLVFQNFIQVFTKREHPLVIFLDDLQWADAASLKLMQLLMTDSDSQYLFLIGAYRDNEVNNAHPVILMVDEIRKAGAIVNYICLSHLNLHSVNQLISETLRCNLEKVKPLSELVLGKTNGNPFFIKEFLKTLYTERLLNFNFTQGGWQWDLEQIQARGITDNVVELMAGKIKKLNDVTQQVLQRSACIGNQFDLQTLAMSCEKSQKETAILLKSAIAEGLILPLSDAYKMIELDVPQPADELKIEYKFAHDRIQQAAYSLIPVELAVHRQVGQLLLQNIPLEKREEKIFDIVNHLNFSLELINHQSERDELAQLNLIAGKKAKAAAAYEPGLKYLQVGIKLLGEDSWTRQYDLILALHVEAAEAAYLSTDFEQMEILAEVVLKRAGTLLDKVKVYEVKIQAHTAQNKLGEAVKIGLEVLKLLGIKLPEKPSKLNILLGLLRTKLTVAAKRIEGLIDLPQMTDPYNLAIMRILSRLPYAAYFAEPELLPLIVFKMVNLSVKHGNASVSAYAYASYGLILCALVKDIDSGYRFGQLALSLVEKFNAKELKAKIIEVVETLVRHWKVHVRETLTPLLEAYQSGLETGDLEFAALCAHVQSYHSYFIGKEVGELEHQIVTYSEAIGKLQQKIPLNYNKIFQQIVFNLRGQSENPCRLIGEAYDEEKMLPIHFEANDKTAINTIHFHKLILCYLFQEFSQAVENAAVAEKYLDTATGTIGIPVFYFYDSLAQLAIYNLASKVEKKRILLKVAANQKKMKKWAEHAPMNRLHKFYLVEAERNRVIGQDKKAIDFYDRAIELAKENEYLNEEALANELAARFYLSKGKTNIAQAYMLDARYCYLKWGATRKVRDLDTRYPHLLSKMPEGTIRENIVTKDSTSGSGEDLDLKTVLKASQAIASEIKLDKLLAKLMKIIMENAGAQNGYLILSKNQKLFIEAAATVDPAQEIVRQSIPVTTSLDLPTTLINYVERTGETIVLDSATESGLFRHDPYITTQKPKSILCTPILNQGKLISIIYLENNLTIGAFTSERLEMLRLLCSQAAVSLENAQLYEQVEKYSQTLEQKVAERTLELQAKNEQLQQEIRDRQRAEDSLQTAYQQLERLACLDGLTQIANRRRFDEYLSQEWRRLTRETAPISLILCDIDYFKRYNDTYGHQAGDACLQQVAGAISGVVKRPADLVARYGGEEFAVILPNTKAEGAAHVARTLHKEVQQLQIPHPTSSVSQYVTLSVGVSSTVPQKEFSPEALIAVADKALYEAKEQGRNRVILKTLASSVSS